LRLLTFVASVSTCCFNCSRSSAIFGTSWVSESIYFLIATLIIEQNRTTLCTLCESIEQKKYVFVKKAHNLIPRVSIFYVSSKSSSETKVRKERNIPIYRNNWRKSSETKHRESAYKKRRQHPCLRLRRRERGGWSFPTPS
jgi:hypothetical protein